MSASEDTENLTLLDTSSLLKLGLCGKKLDNFTSVNFPQKRVFVDNSVCLLKKSVAIAVTS